MERNRFPVLASVVPRLLVMFAQNFHFSRKELNDVAGSQPTNHPVSQSARKLIKPD